MFDSLTPLLPLALPFLLVLFRVLGIFAFVPFFNNSSIPMNVKVLLSLAITFCLWNIVPATDLHTLPDTLISIVTAIIGEMSVGLLIGMLVGAAFAGIQLGAHLVSQQMGLSMATLYDPSFEDQSTVIEQVAFWLALVIFLAMGGHRQVVEALIYSFHVVPLGSGGIAPDALLNVTLGAMQAAFHASTRVAMPALVAFFIATLTGGLLSRSMPQMNLMSFGITVNLIVGFIMIMVGLAGWAIVSQTTFQNLFDTIARFLGG
ncbi:MAG TPA: flagellar biosynthetic protein FliR [Phycisphaerae bacterium]|nr:flagellar biosynthetic protein FliR [Phycisphaerae bacterium]